MSIRRAVAFASLGRYASKAVNLGMVAILGRLMGPTEYGVAVLGTSVFMILDAIRELASANYLVQQHELTQQKINSAFTVSLCITIGLTSLVALLAQPVAALYGEPRLERYIYVIAAAFATGPLMQPIYAIWSRALAFRKLAGLDVLNSVVNAGVSIALVWLGFGYMALAWAALAAALICIITAAWLSRATLAKLRPSIAEWRSVIAFGIYGSATAMIFRLSEALALLVIGRLLDTRAVGLLQRANVIATFPDSVVLSGVGAVALPAFAQQSRDGGDLKRSYLSAVTLVSGLQWPLVTLLGTMALPVTLLALGPLWIDVAPLVQMLCIALLFNFTGTLNFSVLVAAGAIRTTLPTALVQVAIGLAVLVAAARIGLHAVVASVILTAPLNLALWIRLVRTQVKFTLGEFLLAVRKSVVVLLASAAGPVAVLALNHGRPSILDAALATALWAAGWLLAVIGTGHPLLDELRRTRASLAALRSRAASPAAD